jgi:glycosyltransferase involved in cell wall biosynthesis
MYFPDFNNIGLNEGLIIGYFVSLIGIVVYYIISVLPIAKLKTTHLEKSSLKEPVSIIICAKNEDDNLTEFLPKVLMQNYPEFEVIVVNDCSIDNTENVIDEFAKIFPNLKKITIKEDDYYKHGKKFAIMVGIKGAKYENLVFTDADCFPANENWLNEMSEGFTDKKEIILGYGAYIKEPGFLNKLIRFDTFLIALNYLSAAVRGNAYMGVGRNLAYKKSLFYKQKGFPKHYHIQSGDDDLFINQACSPTNTNVAVSENSITYSLPKPSFKDWKRQKHRHLTTAPFYKSSSKTLITLGYALQYFFYGSFLSLLFFKLTFISAFIGLVLKMCIQLIIFRKATMKFKEPDLWFLSIIVEPILLILYPWFHFTKFFNRPNKWKS